MCTDCQGAVTGQSSEGQTVGQPKEYKKVNRGYLQVLQAVIDPVATWKPWLGETSLPGGRLERNHLPEVSLWYNNYVYLCCPSVVSLSVQICHSHSFVIPGYVYVL